MNYIYAKSEINFYCKGEFYMSEKFTDPVDELIARHMTQSELDEKASKVDEVVDVKDEDVKVVPDIPVTYNEPEEIDSDPETEIEEMFDDVDYGDDDLAEEIKAEEEADIAEREEKARQFEEEMAAEKAKKTSGPDHPLDMQKTAETFDFERTKIATVTMMVNQVIAKHHIVSGCIPDDIKMRVMGELINIYYRSGEVITPEFEATLLNNWIGGETVEQVQENKKREIEQTITEQAEEKEEARNTTININVEPGTPVTVNVDGEILEEVDKRKEVNVIVHEVSEQEMRSTTIIENSQLDGIITPYESSATDVPLTLPMSAYRCTMGGVSMFDIIKLSSIQNGNSRDADIKTWTLIYNHLKNPSVGTFKTFEDFLKHTDYRDMELLLWGAFVATADEVETISFTCGNPNCRHHMEFKYSPRSIIHVDEKLVPEHYNKTHQVASGKAAVEHWEAVHSKKKIYELPNSKVLIELDDYSAWDYHNIKMPIMQEIYNRYRPNGGNVDMEALSEDESNEMNFLLLFLLYIKSVTINKDGKSYRYTNWKDIERVVTSHIGNKDLSILISIINQVRNVESPISFYLENVKCPKCGRKDDRIPVNDIMRSLFFQLSNGLNNTTVNFVETGKI